MIIIISKKDPIFLILLIMAENWFVDLLIFTDFIEIII